MAEVSQENHAPSAFEAVEKVWAAPNASLWRFRNYLAPTLTGLVRVVLSAADETGITCGFACSPISIRKEAGWWPVAENTDLIVYQDQDWKVFDDPDKSITHDEVCMMWAGPKGTAMIIARQEELPGPKRVLAHDAWQVRVTWDAGAVQEAALALLGTFAANGALETTLKDMVKTCENLKTNSLIKAQIEATMSMADHMDPRTRSDSTERLWTDVYNSIQFEVAWQLYSDRLLPSIGRSLERTIGYDFIDVHVFNQVGARYEEFLTWQDNRTGYGQNLSLFISKDAVESVLSEAKPRLIRMTKDDGVLNPQLAQLAGLTEGLMVPLVHEGSIQGIATLYYTSPTGLQQSDLVRIGKIGEVIARSIENSNAHEDMRIMASIDALTGIANRRSFNEEIEREVHRSIRYRLPLSLIMIDIDHFKLYNDANGHLKGDYLLRDFARILQSMVREEDTVARYGGEEFAVILPHTKAKNAVKVAEKIRLAIYETDFPDARCQPDDRLTISLGVADTDGTIQDYHELIDMADKALYKAKEIGRNQTLLYSSELASHSV